MKTLKEFLLTHLAEANKRRLVSLKEIKAPKCLIDQMISQKVLIEEGNIDALINIDKRAKQIIDWEYQSIEWKKGNGGKSFATILCKEGAVNYFPQAKYGRYLTLANL